MEQILERAGGSILEASSAGDGQTMKTITRDFVLSVIRSEENLRPGQWIDTNEKSDPATCRVCAIGSIIRRLFPAPADLPSDKYRERIQGVSSSLASSLLDPKDIRFLQSPGEWNLPAPEIFRRAGLVVPDAPGFALSWVFESLGRSFGKELAELTPEDIEEIRARTAEFVERRFPETIAVDL